MSNLWEKAKELADDATKDAAKAAGQAMSDTADSAKKWIG